MSDPALPSKSRGARAYEALISALRDGKYQPGDRLREEEVSNALKLSRTPVREALRRLEADGIVEHRARLGAVVRQLSHGEIVELYEMRMILERTATEMATKHGSNAEFDVLETLNARISLSRNTPQTRAAINQDFHSCIYTAGRNRFLLEAARALNNSLLLLGPTTYTDAQRINVVVEEHAQIITALRAGDAQAAGQLAAAHLDTSLRYRLAHLTT